MGFLWTPQVNRIILNQFSYIFKKYTGKALTTSTYFFCLKN